MDVGLLIAPSVVPEGRVGVDLGWRARASQPQRPLLGVAALPARVLAGLVAVAANRVVQAGGRDAQRRAPVGVGLDVAVAEVDWARTVAVPVVRVPVDDAGQTLPLQHPAHLVGVQVRHVLALAQLLHQDVDARPADDPSAYRAPPSGAARAPRDGHTPGETSHSWDDRDPPAASPWLERRTPLRSPRPMDVLTMAWHAAGAPDVELPTREGLCARCGAGGALIATAAIVSCSFTAYNGWSDPTRPASAHRMPGLPEPPAARHRPPGHPGRPTVGTDPQRGRRTSQAAHGPRPGAPGAHRGVGRVTIEDAHLSWSAADVDRLAAFRRDERMGDAGTPACVHPSEQLGPFGRRSRCFRPRVPRPGSPGWTPRPAIGRQSRRGVPGPPAVYHSR